jgi:hypothetical protein
MSRPTSTTDITLKDDNTIKPARNTQIESQALTPGQLRLITRWSSLKARITVIIFSPIRNKKKLQIFQQYWLEDLTVASIGRGIHGMN